MKLILWWLLISPLAASITNDAPHTNRMAAVLPILPVMISLGIYWLFLQFKSHKRILIFSVLTILIAYLINFSVYMDRYYVHFPKDEVQYWGNWHKEITKILMSDQYKNYQVIMINPEQSPYIFILFYSGFDPATYQKEAVRYPETSDGFLNVKNFNRFTFRSIDWVKDIKENHKTVLVDYFDNIPALYKNTSIKIGNYGLYIVQ